MARVCGSAAATRSAHGNARKSDRGGEVAREGGAKMLKGERGALQLIDGQKYDGVGGVEGREEFKSRLHDRRGRACDFSRWVLAKRPTAQQQQFEGRNRRIGGGSWG
jgi:hypothetical protein